MKKKKKTSRRRSSQEKMFHDSLLWFSAQSGAFILWVFYFPALKSSLQLAQCCRKDPPATSPTHQRPTEAAGSHRSEWKRRLLRPIFRSHTCDIQGEQHHTDWLHVHPLAACRIQRGTNQSRQMFPAAEEP